MLKIIGVGRMFNNSIRITRIFEKYGWEVEVFKTIDEVRFGYAGANLLILDVFDIKKSLDFIYEIKLRFGSIFTIVVLCSHNEKDILKFFNIGCNDVIKSPVVEEELVMRIKKLLQEKN